MKNKNESAKSTTSMQESETQEQKKPLLIRLFSKLSPGDWISLVMAVLTFISVIFIKLTLNEMQDARDAAYRPYIVMNAMNETAEWDSDGDLVWLKNYSRPIESTQEVDDDGTIHGTVTVPVITFKPSSFFDYSVINIGEGVATETFFEWHNTNSNNLFKYLCSLDSKYEEFYSGSEYRDIFECSDTLYVLDKEDVSRLMYLEPEAQKTYNLDFPAQYSFLTGMIMKDYEQGSSDQLPFLYLYIDFNDIQNKPIREIIMISINLIEKKENPDGSGSVTYQYSPHLLRIDEIK